MSESAFTTDSGARAADTGALAGRRDVLWHRGRFALRNSHLTPAEATASDLLFIGAVLDAAGIDYVLMRGSRSRPRPVIAVDGRDRQLLVTALADASLSEPLYSKPRGGDRHSAVLVSSGLLSNNEEDRVFRLFRPRVWGDGRLAYGASFGVQLEFWSYRADEIVLPRQNALTRRVIPMVEAVRSRVVMHGREWPTFEGAWDALAGDIRFDIDMVFSWVDGAELQWQRERAKRMASYVVGEGDDHEARFRQLDELKYALRSVHLFAPWVRNIYIVTDSPRPAWLDEHPRVSVLRSEEFFADTSVLPTHNSHAVESQLHNISGLSEHFIYSNDDMFFGRPVPPQAFFSTGGVSRFIEATTRIGMGAANASRSGYENAARVNRALLRERFGQTITRHLEHAPAPLRVSVLRELETEFPAEFARTAASRFRSATDISVTNSLYHYYALMTGRAVRQTESNVRYVDTTVHSGLDELKRLLKRRDHDFFCLNDGSFPELSPEHRAHAIRTFLEDYFPLPAPWERAAVSADEASAGEVAG